ncbi:universal stress protein [Halogeometricum limi]|uniref:Nucleotide-binding universal stress protein, UspA family n=1 Tax=Halogeometricum limi TaxID=555875 RepID=A0A1I6HLM7_9EURY|nr:universal stress protein [Halogeometricum limi]SFR55336.1 Nucleotide-binding universal stress protein, UspA family [Halogeometricum limi]
MDDLVDDASESLFARPLVPVAGEDDARATAAAVLPRVAAVGGRPVFVHVIEKAGGAPDKAPLEQREELAEELFAAVRRAGEDAGVTVETDLRYGTDVADAIIDAAHEFDATCIAFTPRGGSRWWDLFSGDTRDALVTESDLPVVALPDASEEGESS